MRLDQQEAIPFRRFSPRLMPGDRLVFECTPCSCIFRALSEALETCYSYFAPKRLELWRCVLAPLEADAVVQAAFSGALRAVHASLMLLLRLLQLLLLLASWLFNCLN